jgi:hypothetical protein
VDVVGMGYYVKGKTSRLAAFGLACGFLMLLVRLHGQYNLDWEYTSLSLKKLDAKGFVAKEIYRIALPFDIQRVIHTDSLIYNGSVVFVNIVLAMFLKTKRGGIGLLIGLLLFFISLDKFMHYFVFNLRNQSFYFLLLNVANIRQFLEILPVLPFMIDYFSSYPNLKP